MKIKTKQNFSSLLSILLSIVIALIGIQLINYKPKKVDAAASDYTYTIGEEEYIGSNYLIERGLYGNFWEKIDDFDLSTRNDPVDWFIVDSALYNESYYSVSKIIWSGSAPVSNDVLLFFDLYENTIPTFRKRVIALYFNYINPGTDILSIIETKYGSSWYGYVNVYIKTNEKTDMYPILKDAPIFESMDIQSGAFLIDNIYINSQYILSEVSGNTSETATSPYGGEYIIPQGLYLWNENLNLTNNPFESIDDITNTLEIQFQSRNQTFDLISGGPDYIEYIFNSGSSIAVYQNGIWENVNYRLINWGNNFPINNPFMDYALDFTSNYGEGVEVGNYFRENTQSLSRLIEIDINNEPGDGESISVGGIVLGVLGLLNPFVLVYNLFRGIIKGITNSIGSSNFLDGVKRFTQGFADSFIDYFETSKQIFDNVEDFFQDTRDSIKEISNGSNRIWSWVIIALIIIAIIATVFIIIRRRR